MNDQLEASWTWRHAGGQDGDHAGALDGDQGAKIKYHIMSHIWTACDVNPLCILFIASIWYTTVALNRMVPQFNTNESVLP